ncbi:MAG: amidohydrolase [Bacteroidaceae bacterium]|nr:amidohydrolase [Bacteroidaceae bacterium]
MEYLIIDAHAHLWAKQDTVWNGMKISPLPNGRSMFLGNEVQMCPPFMIDGKNTAEVFLSNMDYAQVAGSVVTQEFIDGIQNDYYKTVNAQYGDRLKCLYMLDYMNGEFTLPQGGWEGVVIPGHRIYKDGVRMPINGEEFMKMFKEMEKRGLILSLCLEDNEQTAEFREVIQECPELKVAIGHFGMPTEQTWYEQVKLAENENVMVESGGITWLYNSEFYPFPTAVKKIKEAADMVGIEKLMWGSDYPRTITAITYKMSYDFVLKTNELTDNEKRLFLGENAKKFYGFGELEVPKYVKNMSE